MTRIGSCDRCGKRLRIRWAWYVRLRWPGPMWCGCDDCGLCEEPWDEHSPTERASCEADLRARGDG